MAEHSVTIRITLSRADGAATDATVAAIRVKVQPLVETLVDSLLETEPEIEDASWEVDVRRDLSDAEISVPPAPAAITTCLRFVVAVRRWRQGIEAEFIRMMQQSGGDLAEKMAIDRYLALPIRGVEERTQGLRDAAHAEGQGVIDAAGQRVAAAVRGVLSSQPTPEDLHMFMLGANVDWKLMTDDHKRMWSVARVRVMEPEGGTELGIPGGTKLRQTVLDEYGVDLANVSG